MGDENFDPCECVWGHELAMRRLLSLLRQSQSHCTDTECFQDGATTMQETGQTPESGFFMMTIICLFALLMFFTRPRLQENSSFEPTKAHIRENNGSGDGSPPNPPPASC